MKTPRRKRYDLEDIENLLTYLPLLFIILFALLVLTITFFTLRSQEKNQIALLVQKQHLETQFQAKETLNTFIKTVKETIDVHLESTQIRLQQSVNRMQGVAKGLKKPQETLGITELLPFIIAEEATQKIKFVILEKETLLPSYGFEEILTLQKLIFNNYNNPRSMQLTTQYILSQGEQSTMTWKNEPEQTVWLSHFQKMPYNNWYLGAFSSVNSIAELTKEALVSTIQNTKSSHSFWVYDYENQLFFNATGKKRWLQSDALSLDENSLLAHAKSLFSNDAWETQKTHPLIYDFNRFRLAVGISDTPNLPLDTSRIHDDFSKERSLWFLLIVAIVAILVTASLTFSGFIKRIFASYNQKLQTLKERFELAIIASNDGLWDTNFKTGKTFFSKTWLDMLGYKEGDVTSYQAWEALIHPDDKPHVLSIMNDHLAGKRSHFMAEYRLRTKKNRYRWVLARGKVFTDDQGILERLLMLTMDIVERKRIEKALDDTQLLVKEGDIVLLRWINDPRLTVTFASQSIERFGYSPDDLLQGALMYVDLIHPDDKETLFTALQEHITQKEDGMSHIYRIIDKHDTVRWVFQHAIFIRDDFGSVTDLYGYIYDITAIKQSETELSQKVQEEVAKNREKDRLLIQQSKLAAMGEMLGSIAHQWRQPLNHISLLIHFIRDAFVAGKLDESSIKRYTQEAKAQIDYMSDTIDDFRNFYKPSKDKAPFEIQTALTSAVQIVKHQLNHHGITLSISGEKSVINGYENEFRQAILNILTNAKDALLVRKTLEPFTPTITLTCKEEKGQCQVEICNNGGSIPDNVMERIFEPYFTTKFETQGTGIGLYMTKTIIEDNMQGKITVENQEDGVCFRIVLPK